MTINELCKQAHEAAKEKGFWDTERNKGELLMLCVSELSEALEALRKDYRQTKTRTVEYGEGLLEDTAVDSLDQATWKKNTYEDELADVFIRLADLCGSEGIDIEWQIKKKLSYNKGRPYKHGKQF